jgi:hypothetical protein
MIKYEVQMNKTRNGPKIKYIRNVGITNAMNVWNLLCIIIFALILSQIMGN